MRVEMLYGHRYPDQSDLDRALAAAERVFREANIEPEAAHASFAQQWLDLNSADRAPETLDKFFDGFTGLGRLWLEANDAACKALTEGWSRPEAAACTIAL